MAQLAASEKAKEEAKAARGKGRNTKKAAAPPISSGTDAANLLENMYHEGMQCHRLRILPSHRCYSASIDTVNQL